MLDMKLTPSIPGQFQKLHALLIYKLARQPKELYNVSLKESFEPNSKSCCRRSVRKWLSNFQTELNVFIPSIDSDQCSQSWPWMIEEHVEIYGRKDLSPPWTAFHPELMDRFHSNSASCGERFSQYSSINISINENLLISIRNKNLSFELFICRIKYPLMRLL